ncbi:MAG: hypothetical protein ABR955_01635 [Verrucomicrobiota bacterium]|jgi:hypothetical protein
MKLKNKIITVGAALAFLTFATCGLQAQITNLVTITATAWEQGTNYNITNIVIKLGTTNVTVYTKYVKPPQESLDTKDILKELAKDEDAAGLWTSNNFPSGAQLAVIDGGDITNKFVVLGKTNNLLVVVTNIVSLAKGTNDIDVVSGEENDTTGLYSPSKTDMHLLDFIFDDTAITNAGSGDIKFDLLGLDTQKVTDTKPVASGAHEGDYTETVSTSVPSAVGEGTDNGIDVVLTGSITGTGSVKLVYVAP